MRSRWDDADAAAAVQRWGRSGPNLALCVYASRLIGADATLVLHGGGNASVKQSVTTIFGEECPALYVKGSGADLGTIEPQGFTALFLASLARLRQLRALADADMLNQFRMSQLDAAAPAPSVETLLHAFLPHRFVLHSHADALLGLSNQPAGEERLRQAIGQGGIVLPYTPAGFALATEVAAALERQPHATAVAIAQHGLFTFADDARRAYEHHIAVVDACEQALVTRQPERLFTPRYTGATEPTQLAVRAAPILRGLLAERRGETDGTYRRLIGTWRGDGAVLEFVNSAEAAALAETGPLTPDHVIRTKPFALFVADPAWHDTPALRQQLKDAVTAFGERYLAYVQRYAAHTGLAPAPIDPLPRVVLLAGAGAFCFGRSKREADIAADITVQGLRMKAVAHALGGYRPAAAEHLYAMEHWGLQQAKLAPSAERRLEGQVVCITGAAGAIGYGIAQVCAEAGAHLVLTDIDLQRVSRVAERINVTHGRSVAAAVAMDVSDEASVRAALDAAACCYGGVDVVVVNAGIAHVAPVADLSRADFERVMAVNATGAFLTMREGIRLLRAQGIGGNIVINASKNVFGPGKDFGAYSASKAAGHQLGKVAAIELAAEGIRVNMINADAIFGEDEVESGLWATVGPERARSRGLKLEELPEYYRSRNLLHARVTARHVGNAVVFFASNQTPTTGATLPVDGGVVEAFPR